MKTLRSPIALLMIAVLSVASLIYAAAAPTQKPRISPHGVTSAVVDEGRVSVYYGRPYTKDPKSGEIRKIWGGLVPYGKVWRTGANEATLLITQKAIKIGDANVPAGAYTLFTLPNEDGSAKLIINKQIGQWGLQYDEKQDLARTDLKKDALDDNVDQFMMDVSKSADGKSGTISMMWEKTMYSVSFSVAK